MCHLVEVLTARRFPSTVRAVFRADRGSVDRVLYRAGRLPRLLLHAPTHGENDKFKHVKITYRQRDGGEKGRYVYVRGWVKSTP